MSTIIIKDGKKEVSTFSFTSQKNIINILRKNRPEDQRRGFTPGGVMECMNNG